jgi:uncharacterized protein
MLFARRSPLSLSARLSAIVWPKLTLQRSTRYIWLRTRRTGASPHKLALGVAIGVGVATTPLLGIQFLLAGALAWLMRGSIPAAVAGTFWANPITCPPIWVASYGIGAALLGHDPFAEGRGVPEALARLGAQVGALTLKVDRDALLTVYGSLAPILKPVLIGSIPLSLGFAVIVYAVTYRLACQLPKRSAAGSVSRDISAVEPELRWS